MCVCVCARRDVGVKAIENLMEKKGKFDYILLETTGLADPGPIASMFWLDDDLGSEIYLDGTKEILFHHNSLHRQTSSHFATYLSNIHTTLIIGTFVWVQSAWH